MRYLPALGLLLILPTFAFASPPSDPAFYQEKGAFEISGTISKVESDEIEIARDGLPDAELEISKQHTKITVNGKPGQASQLTKGTPVRAKFQLDGDDIVAISIEAGAKAQ